MDLWFYYEDPEEYSGDEPKSYELDLEISDQNGVLQMFCGSYTESELMLIIKTWSGELRKKETLDGIEAHKVFTALLERMRQDRRKKVWVYYN